MNLKDFKKELFKNKEVKEEYEKYDLTFEIGQMLIEARVIKGLTQEKLAEMIGTKQSGIARAENSSYLPSLSFLNKIALALRTHLIVRFGFMEKETIRISENNSASHSTITEQIAGISQITPVLAYSNSKEGGTQYDKTYMVSAV